MTDNTNYGVTMGSWDSGTTYKTIGEIVKIDPPETKDRKIVLQGEHGQFVEPFTPDRFKKMGYALERVADDADATT